MIVTLGAGSWGTALATVVARNNTATNCLLYARNAEVIDDINLNHTNQKYLGNLSLPKNLKASADLASLIGNTKHLLIVVPSHTFTSFLDEILPFITPDHQVVWATKGLDQKTGKFLSVIAEEKLPKGTKIGMLSGPSFAKEVVANLPTAVVMASEYDDLLVEWQNLFHTNMFRVYKSNDLYGVQLCGVMKNILAVAAGIADGLALGANARAALIARGMAELSRLAMPLNASLDTLLGLAGVGDIVLTCTDDQSRNRRLGRMLSQGITIADAQNKIGQAIEAITNTKALLDLAAKHNVEMPITEQMFAVFSNTTAPDAAVNNLLARGQPQ